MHPMIIYLSLLKDGNIYELKDFLSLAFNIAQRHVSSTL